MSTHIITLWQCSLQQWDKPVLNLSAKINVHVGEILAQNSESEKKTYDCSPIMLLFLLFF